MFPVLLLLLPGVVASCINSFLAAGVMLLSTADAEMDILASSWRVERLGGAMVWIVFFCVSVSGRNGLEIGCSEKLQKREILFFIYIALCSLVN